MPQLSRPLGELGLGQAAPRHMHTRQPAPHPTRICKASSSHTPLLAAARHVQGQGAELALGQAGDLGGAQYTWLGQAQTHPLVRNVDAAQAGPGKAAAPPAPAQP